MKDYEERSYYDIQLTNKQIIVLFIAGIAILALVFFLGLMLGKSYTEAKNAQQTKTEERTTAEYQPKEVKALPQQETQQPKKEYEFYKLKEEKEKRADTQPSIITPAPEKKAKQQPKKEEPSQISSTSNVYYSLQIYALKDKSAAQKKESEYKEKGYSVTIASTDGLYKVRIGKFATRDEAQDFKKILEKREKLPAIIVTY
ncbi:MAG: hypothetical protein A2Y62_20505 [Candidatus Fischerbacteria bacterium RBG_13_37_8]|uniref:SPOR domain-containing protein n=1 Tax=Candidatus Fischerbacteria bacterium RBG_13_37_8 TaxID=1817863 RepID=A0A1F5VEH2_9BACT|nr:MAG: hypothetical protein A2Y62_20505 [Candidatus Fischerbacteria bacterium RBG_13_37_8]